MNSVQAMRRHGLLAAAGLWLLAMAFAAAAQPPLEEPYNTGWALSVDNDVLSPNGGDRDYTGGFSLTLGGRRAKDAWWSLDGLRGSVDHVLGLDSLYADRELTRHSVETGVTIFNPGSINVPEKQVGDRPYAGLVYFAHTAVEVEPARDLAYLSTLTLGVLGLPIVGDAQKAFHRAIGSPQPVGWENQISNGGEPTFRYAFARVKRSWAGELAGVDGELTTTWRASVGYITEASYGVATRFGAFRTPWWSYNPQIAEYAEKSVPVVASEGGGSEHYFWGGFNVKARAYNAFLQGQFRESAVTFSSSELNHMLVDGWLGYTWATAGNWRFSYVLRAQSAEVRSGPANHTETWGGIILSYAL
jgi:hypothetical protein